MQRLYRTGKKEKGRRSSNGVPSCDISLPALVSSYSKRSAKSDVMFNNFTVN